MKNKDTECADKLQAETIRGTDFCGYTCEEELIFSVFPLSGRGGVAYCRWTDYYGV